MRKIALFGSKGYLGRQLEYYFTQRGFACDGFDLPECDIVSLDFWASFDPSSYEAILFFSGLTGTEQGFADAVRYVSVNEIGLLNLLNKLAPLGASAPKLIFPSTRLVYRGAEHPLDEDDPKETKTIYAVNKLACENYLAAYRNRYGIPYAVIRICVPYGNLISSDYSYGTLGFFLKQAAQGVITIYGDGSQKRTFTHVADICEVIYRLSRLTVNGVFNIGGEVLSLYEVAQIVTRRKSAVICRVPWPESAKRLETGSTYFNDRYLTQAVGSLVWTSIAECNW